ncbi:MAG: hypothetical protein RMJ53_04875 [Chitinophagales bacterium]|nr:hypothetical protein [Chitinophagales bacterium]MDW8273546.1 hypothetical protein [Chitinophagales bacterium]
MEVVLNDLIDKIADIKYMPEDVLKDSLLIEQRKDKIRLASILGTNYGKKTRLKLVTDSETVLLEEAIFAFDNQYVYLKGGVKIPIRAIEEVKLY